jgi:hypothetical protein
MRIPKFMTEKMKELSIKYGDKNGSSLLGALQRTDDFAAGFQACCEFMLTLTSKFKIEDPDARRHYANCDPETLVESYAAFTEGRRYEHSTMAAQLTANEATIAELKTALLVASNQLEGLSLAISQHGQNIDTEFFIKNYMAFAVEARKPLGGARP